MHNRHLSTCLIAFTFGLFSLTAGMAQPPFPGAAAQPATRTVPCDCCETHPEQVGCSDPDCQSTVCAWFPACCFLPWSETCAVKAMQICECCDCNDNGIPDSDDTAVEFQQYTIEWTYSSSSSLFPTDLDGDGDLDLLLGPGAWRENLDGSGTFGPEQATGSSGKSATAGDLDGDGYNDIVTILGAVIWYENLDGSGGFGPLTVLPCPYTQGSRVQIQDLDNDGDNDLFLKWSSTLLWFRNLDGLGAFEECESLASHSSPLEVANLADLDGDGDLDIFAGGDQVVWFEHLDGLGTFGPVRIIAPEWVLASDVWAADLDGDQDNDVLMTSLNGPVFWYENQGTDVWPEHALATPPGNSRGVRTADLDDDGDQDVVVATTPQTVYWYENEDGGGSFAPARTLPVGAWFAGPADLDGDGDQDLVAYSRSSHEFHWFENLRDDCNDNQVPDECEDPAVAAACLDRDHDGMNSLDDCDDTSPWCGNDCTDADQDGFCETFDCDDVNSTCTLNCTDGDDDGYCVTSDCDDGQPDCNAECIDEDGDGARVCDGDCDDDAFFCGLVDCEQDCNANSYPDACDVEVHFEPEVIGTGDYYLIVADIDHDGDNDAVLGDKIFRNLDGLGNFSPVQPVPGGTVDVADVDLDGDADLIGRSGRTIHWSENMDGTGGSFGPSREIETLPGSSFTYLRIIPGDLDGDGDPDVIRGTHYAYTPPPIDGEVRWFANRVREGLGWDARAIVPHLVVRGGAIVDVDGDQDNDFLYWSRSCDYHRIQWLENADGLGNFGTQHTLDEVPTYDGQCNGSASRKSVLFNDLDGDGDFDVVGMGSWYENLDGSGTFGPARGAFEEGDPDSAADLDGDGDLDLVATYNWYENLDGVGTFSPGYPIGVLGNGFPPQAAILDGDGDVDLIALTYDDVLVLYDNIHADCNQNTIPDGCEDPEVELGCMDLDLDGFSVLVDCDDANPTCTVDCTDADGDGFCADADCDDANPGCTLSCLDVDSDGFCAGRDCALVDPTTYPGAEEINDGKDNQCPGSLGHGLIDEISGDAGFNDPGDKNRYSWEPQAGATSYEVGRAESAEFTVNCASFAVDASFLVDENEPAGGVAFYYLVRPTAPNGGSWGADSGGTERAVSCSP